MRLLLFTLIALFSLNLNAQTADANQKYIEMQNTKTIKAIKDQRAIQEIKDSAYYSKGGIQELKFKKANLAGDYSKIKEWSKVDDQITEAYKIMYNKIQEYLKAQNP